jgi:hypothetical protein
MPLSVRVVVLLSLALCASVASAVPHGFYRAENASAATITLEHHQTPFEACEAAEGLLYAAGQVVAAVTFDPASSGCTAVLDDGTSAAITIVSGSGSCPDDAEFDFARQTCEALAGDDQLYAVAVAIFAWLVLMGGMHIGYQFGS